MQINNSELQNWKFINSYASGKISNSLLQYFRVWGGFFNPVFENSEPDHFGIWHKPMKHSPDFDRTYRTLFRANTDLGNHKEATKFKLMELDFIGEKQKGLQYYLWWINKHYWGYGWAPLKIIRFTLLAILFFGIIFSFAPGLIIIGNTETMSLAEKTGNSLYGSICTFVTLGYSGNIAPQGFFKVIASIEAILGAITMGFLVVSLTKTKE
ncbi:hypothetical protein [Pedobacter sp. R20-19]|uniref:hypothetical protein n=1 Tax=Pedobacter sp. R20-19 TaxID=1270196 RepID=UPI0004935581|nr:hypothetical protein [Pedobacter sp. R20-19]